MSKTKIPWPVKVQLWRKSAGRCEYEGCNRPLWRDSLSGCEFNVSYIAHIYGEAPGSARYDAVLSPELKADCSNLMVLCDEHHRLIDTGDLDRHPPERLQGMKRRYEQRIEMLTAIHEDRRSHVLLYGANTGAQYPRPTVKEAACAMVPGRYPAEPEALELTLGNSPSRDHEDGYWMQQREHLRRQFEDVVRPKLKLGRVDHLSVFGFAPQPLLIELGRLLSDIPAAEVFQRHREPPDWEWRDHPAEFSFIVQDCSTRYEHVALNLSLSATVDNSRITSVLGPQTSVWTIAVEPPHNDFLKSREQLRMFRETLRQLLDRIKAAHGHGSLLHVFPAVPVAVAVEIGRVWMPKADLRLRVYDENRALGGFVHALDITCE